MIKYQLVCSQAHEFEGWFRDSADFDVQSEGNLIECPVCGDANVKKAIMAPAIGRRSNQRGDRLRQIAGDMAAAAERARKYVEKNFDYVGDKFPEEARKIHYGETDERGIYGQASGAEVKELIDEGVQVAPMPGAKKQVKKADNAPKAIPADSKKLN